MGVLNRDYHVDSAAIVCCRSPAVAVARRAPAVPLAGRVRSYPTSTAPLRTGEGRRCKVARPPARLPRARGERERDGECAPRAINSRLDRPHHSRTTAVAQAGAAERTVVPLESAAPPPAFACTCSGSGERARHRLSHPEQHLLWLSSGLTERQSTPLAVAKAIRQRRRVLAAAAAAGTHERHAAHKPGRHQA